MANLNKVMLIGNLTADPEVRSTPRGTQLTELRLAVSRQFSGQGEGERREEVTFLDVTCWGRVGEIAAQYLAKGRPVFVEGRLQMDSWEDKQTGQKRSRIRVIAENIQLLGSRNEGGGSPSGASSQGAPSGGGGYQGGSQGGGGGYQQRSNSGGGYNQGGGYNNNNARPSSPPAMPAEEEDDIPF